MNAKPHFSVVAFCDAAYRDIESNKSIVAGIYVSDILVSQFPAAISGTFYVELTNPSLVSPDVEFQIYIGGKKTGNMNFTLDQSRPDTAVIMIQSTPILIAEPGSIELKAKFGSGRPIKVLSKNVRIVE